MWLWLCGVLVVLLIFGIVAVHVRRKPPDDPPDTYSLY
jgi:hypothetical protein